MTVMTTAMTTFQVAILCAYLPMAVIVYAAVLHPVDGHRAYPWPAAVAAALLWPAVFVVALGVAMGRRR